MDKTVNSIPKKRWLILIPVCFLTNLFCFMDRQAISLTLAGGMMSDLAMTASLAGFATGIAAVGSMILAVVGGQTAQKGKVKNLISWCILGWSVLSVLTAFCRTGTELAIVRFLLGLVEGTIAPGVATLLTFWFPDKGGERNRAMSAYFTSASAAGVIIGPLGGAIMQFSSWRVLYIILGCASLLTLFLWAGLIYDRPSQAKWLSREERDYIETTIKEEREFTKVKVTSDAKVSGEKVPWGRLFRNKYVIALLVVGFCVNVGQFGFSVWVPTIISNLTKANILNVGLLNTIPNLMAVVGMWVWSAIVVRAKSRRLMVGLPLVLFGITLTVAGILTTKNIGIVFGILLLSLVASFLQAHMPAYYTIPSLVLTKEEDGATRGLMSMFMYCGNFFGTYVVGVLITATGSTMVGMVAISVILVIGGLAALILPKNITANVPSETETPLPAVTTKGA